MAARADEIIKATLLANRASYSFLNLVGTKMFYDLSQKAFASTDFPVIGVQKTAHSGTPKALGTGNQKNRVLVQIDIYALANAQKTVSTVKYYDSHLLKNIATDIFDCLRAHVYETTGVMYYTEVGDRRMPDEQINDMPVVRRTLEIELGLYNAK